MRSISSTELEGATKAVAAGGAAAADIDVLVSQGPGVLRRLYQHQIDVPPLARLALSGDAMIDLDAANADQSLPIVFATAADQLETIAADGNGDAGGSSIGQGVSIPLIALVGVVVALLLPIVAMSWFRRRAERMEALSFVDPLTGLANRRRLDQDLARLDAERTAARQPVSVAMVDVDEFKRFNDTFGHSEGDVALRNVSTTIAAAVRSSDSVYRYGGEEFLVLLRNAPQHAAVDVCDRHPVGRRKPAESRHGVDRCRHRYR
ncbi:MAG: GGDEF domain-containing protein [Acidimicrobiales bacterium]